MQNKVENILAIMGLTLTMLISPQETKKSGNADTTNSLDRLVQSTEELKVKTQNIQLPEKEQTKQTPPAPQQKKVVKKIIKPKKEVKIVYVEKKPKKVAVISGGTTFEVDAAVYDNYVVVNLDSLNDLKNAYAAEEEVVVTDTFQYTIEQPITRKERFKKWFRKTFNFKQ